MPIGNVKRTFRKKHLDQVMFLGVAKKREKDALVFYNLDRKLNRPYWQEMWLSVRLAGRASSLLLPQMYERGEEGIYY